MSLPILTNSRLAVARACQRKHHLQYGLGYLPASENENFRFGTLIHLLLEAWWKGTDDRLGDALQMLELTNCDPFDYVRARVTITGYDARWGADADLYEVLGVEAEFRAPLVNPDSGQPSRTWQLGGKLDGIIREKATGRIGVLEHKTTSEDIGPGSTYWARLRLDPQISIYFVGGQAITGQPVDFTLYDVLKKFSIRPGKATPVEARKYTKDGLLYKTQRDQDETPEEFEARCMEAMAVAPEAYFARGEVVRLDGEVDDAIFDVWQLGQQLREADRVKRYPRNPSSCFNFNTACSFFPVCTGEGSLDDPNLYRKSETAHPELKVGSDVA